MITGRFLSAFTRIPVKLIFLIGFLYPRYFILDDDPMKKDELRNENFQI
jgi:hypothetical protein